MRCAERGEDIPGQVPFYNGRVASKMSQVDSVKFRFELMFGSETASFDSCMFISNSGSGTSSLTGACPEDEGDSSTWPRLPPPDVVIHLRMFFFQGVDPPGRFGV